MIPRSSKTSESEGLALLFWESFPWSIWPLVKESWWDNNPTPQVWRMSEGWTWIAMQFWDLKASGFMQILRPGSIVRSVPLLHVLDFGVSTFLSKHILQCACSQATQHTLVLLLWCKNQYWKPEDVFYWVKIETQLQTSEKLSWKPPLEFIPFQFPTIHSCRKCRELSDGRHFSSAISGQITGLGKEIPSETPHTKNDKKQPKKIKYNTKTIAWSKIHQQVGDGAENSRKKCPIYSNVFGAPLLRWYL